MVISSAFVVFIILLQDLTMETELEAVNGRRVRAIEVFAHALRFFREHALKVKAPSVPSRPSLDVEAIISSSCQEVKDQSSTVLEGEEVRWVITVPAVWRQPAKQFMREAAYLVGSHVSTAAEEEKSFHSKRVFPAFETFACFDWSVHASCWR